MDHPQFQSTHPRGVRPPAATGRTGPAGFNPRTREGCDKDPSGAKDGIGGFNPRTREGCDLQDEDERLALVEGGFNPRTREGCDEIARLPMFYNMGFNPRTREGCDAIRRPPSSSGCRFNPCTREGCDVSTPLDPSHARMVSIHAPARGATAVAEPFLSVVLFQSTHPRGVRHQSCSR